MDLKQLKEAIFWSGNVAWNEKADEISNLHAIQAEGEFLISEKLTFGEISASEGLSLMQQLMESYGVYYPLLLATK